MTARLVLASGSSIRQTLLRNAGVPFEVRPVRIDETAVREGMAAEDAPPRDIADTLAEMTARRAAAQDPGELILGCDQVLAFDREVLGKPETPDQARDQLGRLRGRRHQLLSAMVIYENAEPAWRHVGVVTLHMREFSDAYLDDYVARNWDGIRDSVGAYKLEEEGVRLFQRIDGDYFTVLGLPLLPLLSYLTTRGLIPG